MPYDRSIWNAYMKFREKMNHWKHHVTSAMKVDASSPPGSMEVVF